jgi:hypothetical protein
MVCRPVTKRSKWLVGTWTLTISPSTSIHQRTVVSTVIGTLPSVPIGYYQMLTFLPAGMGVQSPWLMYAILAMIPYGPVRI